MRHDMQFVLIDRPRSGRHFGKQPKGSRRYIFKDRDNDFDDSLKKESIRKPWKVSLENKQFNDLLGPLKKFLRSKVGCLWNDVYSEIRENISPNSKMQLHLLEHVSDFVKTSITVVNGKILDEKFYPLYSREDYIRFYVCPDTNILKQIPIEEVKKYEKQRILWYNKEKLQQYHQIKGIWYIVQLKTYPKIIFPYQRDIILGNVAFFPIYREKYGGYYYAISKKQLNKKEIKKMKQYEL